MVENDAIADVRWYAYGRNVLPWVIDDREAALEQLTEGLCRSVLDAARLMLRWKTDMTRNWRVHVKLYFYTYLGDLSDIRKRY